MMNTSHKGKGRQVIVIVCLIFLALAAFLGIRSYQYYNGYHEYQFPFSVSEVESLTIYRSRFQQKKEITGQKDIAEFMDAVEGVDVRFRSESGELSINSSKTYCLFRLADGSERYCVCENMDHPLNDSTFFDGDVWISGTTDFNLASYWECMDYEVQEGVGAELAEIMMMFRPDA